MNCKHCGDHIEKHDGIWISYTRHCINSSGHEPASPVAPPDAASPTGGAEPPKYTNRHGEPCSQACGEGRHAECTETGQTCNCTYRGLHKTTHRYLTIRPAAAAEPLYSERELKELGLKASTINYGAAGSATMYSPVEPAAAEPSAEQWLKENRTITSSEKNFIAQACTDYAAHVAKGLRESLKYECEQKAIAIEESLKQSELAEAAEAQLSTAREALLIFGRHLTSCQWIGRDKGDKPSCECKLCDTLVALAPAEPQHVKILEK